eukprot:TRINITY_DN21028_c0_g1_i1.p1 TRINITY_DN21028_c0_g1~~TRINITY_DN21028_c0_g1_i1.p1  ORF type:complete len:361 (-),score=22.74 TRINITY_DN21028_c0_g1_i1:232-1314(-)
MLTPIMKSMSTVIESSKQLLGHIKHYRVPHDYVLLTSDVNNLYPQIPNQGGNDKSYNALIPTLTRRIRSHYSSKSSIASLVIECIAILIKGQHITYNQQHYGNSSGIITGLSAAVTMANIYLYDVDEIVTTDYQSHVAFYYRLVDDALYCVSRAVARQFQTALDSHHEDIQWSHDDPLTTTTAVFLDFNLTLRVAGDSQVIDYSMHRKPQNLYLYIPFASAHPPAVFTSFVQGELNRIDHTNKFTTDVSKHVDVFVRCLLARGYPKQWVQQQISKHLNKSKPTTSNAFAHLTTKTRKHFIKMTFDGSFQTRSLKRLLTRHAIRLSNAFQHSVHVGIAWKVQTNLFRKLYRHNWPTIQPSS